MKLFAVTALLAVASLSNVARALSTSSALRADVPFNFTVGHELLPSGSYLIKRDSSGLVTVQSIDQRHRVVVASTSGPDATRGDKLIFRKYGDRYFLGKVSSSIFSANFVPSKLERSARDHEAKRSAETRLRQ